MGLSGDGFVCNDSALRQRRLTCHFYPGAAVDLDGVVELHAHGMYFPLDGDLPHGYVLLEVVVVFGHRVSSLSTAFSKSLSLGWVYLAVESSLSWPSSLATATRSVPLSRTCLAKLWRST